MSVTSPQSEPKSGLESIGSALEYWRQRLAELPDVRQEKVEKVRGAIQHNCYDSEQVLESTVRLLSNDVGVLCRKETSTGST